MKPNDLIHETSPYLLAHAHNPVQWKAWGDKVLNQAKEENKLILISIGYSACHWCHVMERESFEDEEVAAIMNENFICIKVDREERPDIDFIYMEAVQMMTGHGGWPLNCFALPGGEPVYGGTYFRKDDWKNILLNLSQFWIQKPEDAKNYANRLVEGLHERRTSNPLSNSWDRKDMVHHWLPYLDSQDGGFKGSPKFPLPNAWDFLLELSNFNSEPENPMIQDFLKITLDGMRKGGLFDQLGGGFARYSTDPYWFAPHFEKMLYDNAQLLSLYSHGFLFFQSNSLKKVVQNTIRFLNQELRSPEGGYFSALDADSEGEEGKYYVWTQSEIKDILGSMEPVFSTYYHIRPEGNWEGKNILYIKESNPPLYEKLGMDEEGFLQEMERCKSLLLIHRHSRIRPLLDDKILCSWNALMMKGFCDAYKAFSNSEYLKYAKETGEFILRSFVQGSELKRTYKNGQARISGFLDDYAFLAEAFLALYESSFEEIWIFRAQELIFQIEVKFKDPQNPLYFYTPLNDTPLITRTKEIQDSVIPASNSVLARVFYRLGHFLYQDEYLEKAQNMLHEIGSKILNQGPSYANWSSLALEIKLGIWEVSILGNDAENYRKKLEEKFIPNKIIGGKVLLEGDSIIPFIQEKIAFHPKDKTLIYICKDRVCQIPFENVEKALKFIEQGA